MNKTYHNSCYDIKDETDLAMAIVLTVLEKKHEDSEFKACQDYKVLCQLESLVMKYPIKIIQNRSVGGSQW